MKKIFLPLVLLLLLQVSCKESVIEPPSGKPPGWQEDIPWPSLADSPWPMRHSDPQSTGRSNSDGPMIGQVEWQIESQYLGAEPILSKDSVIFIPFKDSLFAVKVSGSMIWKTKLGVETISAPLLSSSNNIYSGYNQGGIFKLDTSGIIDWSLPGNFDSQINISKDGEILFFNEMGELISISPSGNLLWTFFNPDFKPGASISFSPDGKSIYFPGKTHPLIAFDLNSKSVKWNIGDSNYRGAPLVDSYGNIYLTMKIDSLNNGQTAFFCVSPDRSVRWLFTHYEYSNRPGEGIWNLHGEPTLDKKGNIYFGSDTLYSLDFNGNLRWKKEMKISPAASLICDGNNNLYLIKDYSNYFSVICLNTEGLLKWHIDNLAGESTSAGMIIGFSKLYVPTMDGILYAIH